MTKSSHIYMHSTAWMQCADPCMCMCISAVTVVCSQLLLNDNVVMHLLITTTT